MEVGGGGSTDTSGVTTVSGVAIDPEIQGAIVFLDRNENGIQDNGELNTTTDNFGKYSLDISQADIGKPLVMVGGFDKVTKQAFAGKLTAITTSTTSSQYITPLTTLVEKYHKSDTTKSIGEVKTELANKLGISSDDFDKNIVATGNENLLATALRIQKSIESIESSSSKNTDELYMTLANNLTSDTDLTNAIDNTINKELVTDSLSSRKAKDLDSELRNFSRGSLTSEQLALSMENIDNNITNTTNISDLTMDIYDNSRFRIENDTQVQQEKGRRIFESLGLSNLDESTKNTIMDNGAFDLNNDSIEEWKTKINNNVLGLNSAQMTDVRREQLFNDNGLQNLDQASKDKLITQFNNNNFDFMTSNNEDFKSMLNNQDFFANEDFQARIQGQMNQNSDLATDNTSLDKEITKYLAATNLPTLHALPRITDEDGDATDNKETYTLRATLDVNVTIETPDGSWITPMWRYNNNPLPVLIKTSRNNVMTLNFQNRLTSDSTIHWHGFKIPADMDGGPDYPVSAGTNKTYTFTMNQPAAPLWFHPHPDMQTGKQVYMGLAGVYLLEDSVSKALETDKKIPSGAKDRVLLVQDRRFDAEVGGVRELLYKNQAIDSDGMLGDTILVNGSVMPKQEVSNTKHRYRLYNVSNARNYDFALSDGSDFTVIATDGGFLQKPVTLNHIVMGAAERVEIVIDFSKYNVGDKVLLVSKPTTRAGNVGMGLNTITANAKGLTIMRFDVTNEESEDITLYTDLGVNSDAKSDLSTRLTEDDATNKGNEREFLMSMGMDGSANMTFVINGKSFKADRIDEFIDAGATEIWNIQNMSPMAHPFHAHAIQYQILTRNGIPASGTDLGFKDTFLVQPGETVRIIGDFSDSAGDYMYHCHILEHEDAGMMGYFRVGDTGHLGQ